MVGSGIGLVSYADFADSEPGEQQLVYLFSILRIPGRIMNKAQGAITCALLTKIPFLLYYDPLCEPPVIGFLANPLALLLLLGINLEP